MSKVLCFGEVLLRFSPNENSFSEAAMPFYIGGAELNVAMALAKWAIPVGYCSAMPSNFLSKEIADYITSKKIDSSAMLYRGDRIGSYYLAQGKDMKNDSVVFDRVGSSFSTLQLGETNWKQIFKEVGWFHISAIAASLTQNAADVCVEAMAVAKSMGIPISIDLNYRPKLWKYGKMPTDIMPTLVSYCDFVMGNMWAVDKMLGIPCEIIDSEACSKEELIIAATNSIDKLKVNFPSVKSVAYTFRLEKTYFALLHHNENNYISKEHVVEAVIDKVGSGDCFMAGLLYGTLNKLTSIETVNFAAAAAVGKLYEKGDATSQTIAQIKKRYT